MTITFIFTKFFDKFLKKILICLLVHYNNLGNNKFVVQIGRLFL